MGVVRLLLVLRGGGGPGRRLGGGGSLAHELVLKFYRILYNANLF